MSKNYCTKEDVRQQVHEVKKEFASVVMRLMRTDLSTLSADDTIELSNAVLEVSDYLTVIDMILTR